MGKVSVWVPNSDPGTTVEVFMQGIMPNKTSKIVDGPIYRYSPITGEVEEVDELIIGEPIPFGEEWAEPEPPPPLPDEPESETDPNFFSNPVEEGDK
ncbi:MAG: hypothetical protein ABL876_00185 [Chitinophagaceae bacterium]